MTHFIRTEDFDAAAETLDQIKIAIAESLDVWPLAIAADIESTAIA